MIFKQVQVYIQDKTDVQERLLLSNGTVDASGQVVYGLSYDTGSFKPNKPWRKPTKEEMDQLFAKQSNIDHQTNVGLIKLPNNIIFLAQAIGLDLVKIESDLVDLRRTHPYQYMELMEKIDDFLRPYEVTSKEKVKHKIHVGSSNMETVTIDTAKKCLAGLHIDAWDNLSNSAVEKNARNRVCFNLGTKPRYLLFINLSIKEIYSLVEKKNSKKIEDYNTTTLTTDFFKLYPKYPVAKLKINPFEAYIAPTENIIHDGCTDGNEDVDVNFMIRGYFRLVPAALAVSA